MKSVVLKGAFVLGIVLAGCSNHESRETKYPSGQVKERYQVVKDKNGSFLWDGEYSSWYENGRIMGKGNFTRRNPSDGEVGVTGIPKGGRTGKWVFWHKNGWKMEESNYSDGKFNGLCLQWNESGKLIAESNYSEGVLDGKCRSWYNNGKKENEESFIKGKLNGHFEFWDTNGTTIADLIFVNDSVTKKTVLTDYGKYVLTTGLKLDLEKIGVGSGHESSEQLQVGQNEQQPANTSVESSNAGNDKKYTQKEFKKVVTGLSKDKIKGLLGTPSSLQSWSGSDVWCYDFISDESNLSWGVYDPDAGKRFDMVMIQFNKSTGRVFGVMFN